MSKKIINFTVVLTLILLVFSVGINVLAVTSVGDQILNGAAQAGKVTGQANDKGEAVEFAVGLIKVINILFNFIGVAFFGLMIYGGYVWMMARGEEQSVERAKTLIKEAVIGLIIIIAARIVTEFVLAKIGTIIKYLA